MRVSIITVAYNSASTIEETIKSVLSQEDVEIEYIIIDGGSTDNTPQIIECFKEKINIIVSEPDRGIYDAMNKGIRLASGDIIGVLNSDDIYADNQVIRDVIQQFSSNPNLDILYGNLVYVKKDNTDKVVRTWRSKSYFDTFFENGNVPPHPSLFVSSKVYEIAGSFDLQYNLAADYEFMLRVLKKSNFQSKYINRLIVKMRLGGATNRSLTNIINGNKEILQAWVNNGHKAPLTLMPLRFIKRVIQFF
jgi:glycosyltransferase involved in cell wall biosynthesis